VQHEVFHKEGFTRRASRRGLSEDGFNEEGFIRISLGFECLAKRKEERGKSHE